MSKRHEDLSYFLHVTLINYIPNGEQIQISNKKSLLNAIITRHQITSIFDSQHTIAKISSPLKPFLYQTKISLNQKSLRFSIKLSDLNNDSTYFIKIFIINEAGQKQLSSFKLFMNKYVEAFKVQQKNYFQQNFFQKNGSSLETQVYIEKNRAALEYLLADIKSEKRKKRSLSIKKSRESKNKNQIPINAFTIEKLHKEAEDQKSMRKTVHNSGNLRSTEVKKRKIEEQFDEYNHQIQKQPEQEKKGQDSSVVNKKIGQRYYGLQMSKITQVLNSQNHSDFSKTNILQTFSRERQLLKKSDYSQKMNNSADRILQAIDMSQPTASVISSIIQENPDLHFDKQARKFSQIDINEPGGTVSSLAGSFQSFISRSFIEADGGQEVSLVHSSELSVRTQVQILKTKANKLMYMVMIALAFAVIGWLMIPTNRHYKYLQNKSKRTKKYRK